MVRRKKEIFRKERRKGKSKTDGKKKRVERSSWPRSKRVRWIGTPLLHITLHYIIITYIHTYIIIGCQLIDYVSYRICLCDAGAWGLNWVNSHLSSRANTKKHREMHRITHNNNNNNSLLFIICITVSLYSPLSLRQQKNCRANYRNK